MGFLNESGESEWRGRGLRACVPPRIFPELRPASALQHKVEARPCLPTPGPELLDIVLGGIPNCLGRWRQTPLGEKDESPGAWVSSQQLPSTPRGQSS